MTRLLHTSDWHLGVSLETAPRAAEHTRFLSWLLDELKEREVDVLLISGDIYHYSQPSAAAQSAFYGFLARCQDLPDLRHIVVIAGNHDSPSRLEAPRQVLESVGVSVLGNLDVAAPEDAMVPIMKGSECVAMVVAVPYLSEARLGIATTDQEPSALRRLYAEKFASLHDGLLERCRDAHPGVPVVAMGHLTCSDGAASQDGDFYTPIHSYSAVNGLPTSVFCSDFDYVALGHIHRSHQVGERQIWYSGSPVPVSVVEARTPRFVLQVDLSDQVKTRKVKVPRWRDVFEIEGDVEEVGALIRSLEWDTPLPPYLYVDVVLEEGRHVEVDRYQNMIARHFGDDALPRIVRFRTRGERLESDEIQVRAAALESLTPFQVFERMYHSKHGTHVPEAIGATFRELMAMLESS